MKGFVCRTRKFRLYFQSIQNHWKVLSRKVKRSHLHFSKYHSGCMWEIGLNVNSAGIQAVVEIYSCNPGKRWSIQLVRGEENSFLFPLRVRGNSSEVFPQKVPSLGANAVSEKKAIMLTEKKMNTESWEWSVPVLVSPKISHTPTLPRVCLYEPINSSLCQNYFKLVSCL